MSAFGPAVTRPRAWCNLCRAEGREFLFDPEEPDAMTLADRHTRAAHPEHDAALDRGEAYVPVEVEP